MKSHSTTSNSNNSSSRSTRSSNRSMAMAAPGQRAPAQEHTDQFGNVRKICIRFSQGQACSFGDRCKFWHFLNNLCYNSLNGPVAMYQRGAGGVGAGAGAGVGVPFQAGGVPFQGAAAVPVPIQGGGYPSKQPLRRRRPQRPCRCR